MLHLFFGLALAEFVHAVPASNPQNQTQIEAVENENLLDPSLSSAYLLKSANEVGNPHVIVGRYDVAKGLLAAYQSETGKRILFRSRFLPSGRMTAQILHLDPTTGKITHFVGKSKNLDENGQPVNDVEVAGIDMRAFIKSISSKGNGHAEKEQHLKKFAASDAGQALLDGVPALYAALDGLEQAPEVARLIEPFGAVSMALQLTTKQFRGFKNADKILGAAKAKKLSDACGGIADCVFRGKRFMVFRSGLFDALSKHKGASTNKGAHTGQTSAQPIGYGFPARQTSPELVRQLMQMPSVSGNQIWLKNGHGTCDDMIAATCFGLCGPGCVTPGNVAAPKCYGHDYCVCAHGHLACAVTVPDECGSVQGVTCNNLVEGVGGWLGGLWDAFWNWIDSWFDEQDNPCEEGEICQGS